MKRAQLQSLEPIVVTIMIVLILGVAAMFFFRIGASHDRTQATLLDQGEDLALLKQLTGLPELGCPATISRGTYCLDGLKAEAFSTLMRDPQNKLFYYPLFGDARLTLTTVDLYSGTKQDLVLYDALNATNVRATTTYFTLQRAQERQFAVLLVQREART